MKILRNSLLTFTLLFLFALTPAIQATPEEELQTLQSFQRAIEESQAIKRFQRAVPGELAPRSISIIEYAVTDLPQITNRNPYIIHNIINAVPTNLLYVVLEWGKEDLARTMVEKLATSELQRQAICTQDAKSGKTALQEAQGHCYPSMPKLVAYFNQIINQSPTK